MGTKLCTSIEENYTKRYPNSSSPVEFDVESGRKYWKIIQILVEFTHLLTRKLVKFTNQHHGEAQQSTLDTDLRIINDRNQIA